MQFSLLELLFDEPGKVVPRAEILDSCGVIHQGELQIYELLMYMWQDQGKLEPDPRNPNY